MPSSGFFRTKLFLEFALSAVHLHHFALPLTKPNKRIATYINDTPRDYAVIILVGETHVAGTLVAE